MTVAFPYRVPSRASVQPGPWMWTTEGRTVPVPAMIPDWDCATDLEFSREVVVDLEALAEEAAMVGENIALRLVVQWRASDSLLTRIAFSSEEIKASTTVPVRAFLSGRDLGGTLTLTTSLIVARDFQPRDRTAARSAGSVLWTDDKKIRLTGAASRLPVAVVDFLKCRRDPHAPWTVVVDGPLDAPAMGTVQLLLNSRRRDVVSLLEGRDDGDIARAVRSTLYVAVGRALLERAIVDEDLTEDLEFDDDTLGSVLLGVVGRFDQSLDDLRVLRAQEPDTFTALVDGRLGLLRNAVG